MEVIELIEFVGFIEFIEFVELIEFRWLEGREALRLESLLKFLILIPT